MPTQSDIRAAITNQIIAALESCSVLPGVVPGGWARTPGHTPTSSASASYRGLNPILLDLASQSHGFSTRWWGTFNQWSSLAAG